jgi:glycosyltransferase involved in cell wall biosynthesis
MRVVQNAVDLDRIDRIAKVGKSPHSDQFTIATVGLINIKNPLTVLEAFRQVHDQASQLVYMGEGSPWPIIAKQVEKPL